MERKESKEASRDWQEDRRGGDGERMGRELGRKGQENRSDVSFSLLF